MSISGIYVLSAAEGHTDGVYTDTNVKGVFVVINMADILPTAPVSGQALSYDPTTLYQALDNIFNVRPDARLMVSVNTGIQARPDWTLTLPDAITVTVFVPPGYHAGGAQNTVVPAPWTAGYVSAVASANQALHDALAAYTNTINPSVNALAQVDSVVIGLFSHYDNEMLIPFDGGSESIILSNSQIWANSVADGGAGYTPNLLLDISNGVDNATGAFHDYVEQLISIFGTDVYYNLATFDSAGGNEFPWVDNTGTVLTNGNPQSVIYPFFQYLANRLGNKAMYYFFSLDEINPLNGLNIIAQNYGMSFGVQFVTGLQENWPPNNLAMINAAMTGIEGGATIIQPHPFQVPAWPVAIAKIANLLITRATRPHHNITCIG
jgi:hypothetical protein